MSRIANAQTAECRETAAQAVLKFDGLGLVFPQGDVRTIEASSDILRTDPPPKGFGWIEFFNLPWPVYALSADLEPVADVPSTRSLCAVLAWTEGLFGLLCDDIQVLGDIELAFLPLPECMRRSGSPIHAVALHGQRILCAANVQALAHLTGAAAAMNSQARRLAGI